jgi:hypothetical protein
MAGCRVGRFCMAASPIPLGSCLSDMISALEGCVGRLSYLRFSTRMMPAQQNGGAGRALSAA